MLCSFPDNTHAATEFARVIANWNANSLFPITGFNNDTDCQFALGNWKNEIGLRLRAELDQGANAWTSYAHENICLGGPGDYSEADIQIASDLDISSEIPPGEHFSDCGTAGSCTDPNAGYAFATMAHEMGHQLGLDHDTSHLNMMYGKTSWLPGGINGPTPYPDDAKGIASIYGYDSSKNLFPGRQHRDASLAVGFQVVDNMSADSFTPCANATMSATVTVVSMGKGTTFSQQVWLARNADGSSPVVSFTWADSTILDWDVRTFSFDLSLAGVSPGTYYFTHLVDSANQVAEKNENDNLLVYAKPVVVTDCNGVLAWHSSTNPILL
jgi:hypothetical protein